MIFDSEKMDSFINIIKILWIENIDYHYYYYYYYYLQEFTFSKRKVLSIRFLRLILYLKQAFAIYMIPYFLIYQSIYLCDNIFQSLTESAMFRS